MLLKCTILFIHKHAALYLLANSYNFILRTAYCYENVRTVDVLYQGYDALDWVTENIDPYMSL